MSIDDPPSFQVSKRMSRHVVRATVAVVALSLAVLSSPISMCRKRSFATHRRGRQPVRAAGCRIPCLILSFADVTCKESGTENRSDKPGRSRPYLPSRTARRTCCATTAKPRATLY